MKERFNMFTLCTVVSQWTNEGRYLDGVHVHVIEGGLLNTVLELQSLNAPLLVKDESKLLHIPSCNQFNVLKCMV